MEFTLALEFTFSSQHKYYYYDLTFEKNILCSLNNGYIFFQCIPTYIILPHQIHLFNRPIRQIFQNILSESIRHLIKLARFSSTLMEEKCILIYQQLSFYILIVFCNLFQTSWFIVNPWLHTAHIVCLN